VSFRSSVALACAWAFVVASSAPLRAQDVAPSAGESVHADPAPSADAPRPLPEAEATAPHGSSAGSNTVTQEGNSGPALAARARAVPNAGEAPATSDTDLAIGRLHEVPRLRAEELLTLAPGVLLANHGGEGHASTLFLRGFDAGEGQDVEITVDGVAINDPSNAHGHGYADTGFVIPELVERLRVVEGPFDPRQGDFALAGSAHYTLGLATRGVRAQVEAGTFGHQRLLLTWGPEAASRQTFTAVSLARGDGFGPSRASTRATALAQLEGTLGAGLRGALFATGHVADFASAGVVRADDVAAGRLACPAGTESFFCVADATQGGASTRFSAGARATWQRGGARLEHLVWVAARRLRIRENFTGRLLDARGDGLDERYDATTIGARGSYRFAWRLGGQPQSAELGFVARRTAGETGQDRLRSEGGDAWGTVFDDAITLTNVGVYGGVTLRPWGWLTLRGGLRADALGFGIERRGLALRDRDGSLSGVVRADALGVSIAPRGAVALQLARGLAWTTSVGVGTRSTDAQALSDGERAPFAQAIASETGLALTVGRPRDVALDARSGFFVTRVTRDLVFDAERGRNGEVGPSNRFGALFAVHLRVKDRLEARVSGTWTEAHLVDSGAAPLALAAGPRLPYVPRFVGRADVAARHTVHLAGEPIELGASLGVTGLAARPLPLGTFGEPYVLVDASLRARWRGVELAWVARNLLDARWRAWELAYPSRFGDGPTSMVPATHFAAGAPFFTFVSLSVAIPTVGEPDSPAS
jgi:iron complex outermembrane receptor protein